MDKTSGQNTWTDDESHLLLCVTNEYKLENEKESIDWESKKSKYKDIPQNPTYKPWAYNFQRWFLMGL